MGESLKTIAAFKANEEAVLQKVYVEMYPRVRTYVLKNSGSEQQAKDVFQEAFITCWKHVREERFVKGNLQGYLYSIARNKWIDYLRSPAFKRASSNSLSHLQVVGEEESDPEAAQDLADKRLAVQTAMTQLGGNCRRLLRLFYFEKKSMEQIAEAMGIAANSARNQKYRCMEKLRAISYQINNNE